MAERAIRIFTGLGAALLVGCAASTAPVDGDAGALVAAPSASAPQATAPPRTSLPHTPREVRDHGVRWLVANQNPDGSFGSFASARPSEIYLDNLSSHRAFHVATTALGAWALVEPARADPQAAAALERALDWVLAAPPTGRATGSTFYDVWAHTYLLELSAAVLADPRLSARSDAFRALAEREVLISRDRQANNGGWGYYDFGEALAHPTGRLSTSFNTGAMILALRAVERQGIVVPQEMLRDAIVCLKRMHIASGSYAYGIYVELTPQAGYNRVRGASGRLQVCNLALHDEGVGIDQSVLTRGLEHLRDHHHYIAIARGRPMPHEAWYSNSGYYYYFGHFYAARVAAALDPAPSRTALASWLASVFTRDQFDDGSWFDFPLYGYGHAYATGYAVLSMSTLMPLLDDAPPMAAASP